MEYKVVMRELKRMCESYEKCELCGLRNNKFEEHCQIMQYEYPQEAEEIIMKWAEEHPLKTNAAKFKEVFGVKIPYTLKGCGLIKCPNVDCDKCNNKNFWNKEYKEPKEKI